MEQVNYMQSCDATTSSSVANLTTLLQYLASFYTPIATPFFFFFKSHMQKNIANVYVFLKTFGDSDMKHVSLNFSP